MPPLPKWELRGIKQSYCPSVFPSACLSHAPRLSVVHFKAVAIKEQSYETQSWRSNPPINVEVAKTFLRQKNVVIVSKTEHEVVATKHE